MKDSYTLTKRELSIVMVLCGVMTGAKDKKERIKAKKEVEKIIGFGCLEDAMKEYTQFMVENIIVGKKK